MELAHHIELLLRSQEKLAGAYRAVAGAHRAEADLFYTCQRLADQAERQAGILGPYLERYRPLTPAGREPAEPSATFRGPREPGVGLLRDLQELYLMAAECDLCWMLIDRAAQGARDTELRSHVDPCHRQVQTQVAWLRTQLTQNAVQTLVVA